MNSSLELISVGRSGKTLRLVSAEIDGFGQILVVEHASERHKVRLPLVGAFQASNALVAAGLAFATWARVALGRFWTSAPSIKAEHDLVRTGPYALTRHPIYTGLLLALAATAMLRGTIAALGGLAPA